MRGRCARAGRLALLAVGLLYAGNGAFTANNAILNATRSQPQNVGDAILAATAYHQIRRL